jgi:apolipoprotein N-acyltransferase
MKSNQLALYSLSSALLLSLAWPTLPFFPILFFSFIPVLYAQQSLGVEHLHLKKFAVHTYLFLLVFNIITTWWIWNSTAAGAIFAIAVNALLMLIPWLFYRITVFKLKGKTWTYFTIIPYYILFEYWHINWDLSWPWLTLGNSAAMYPSWVQWYSYTGVLGGTAWILTSNILFFLLYIRIKKQQAIVKLSMIASSVFLLPILLSFVMYTTYKEQGEKIEVVVVQPNIDPYTEKYSVSENHIPYDVQFKRLTNLSEQQISARTQFVLWPETSFPKSIHEEGPEENPYYLPYVQWARQHATIGFVTGIDSYRFFDQPYNNGNIAYETQQPQVYYTPYNAAMFVSGNTPTQFYHKSKLVPGVEILPYPEVFGFLTHNLGDLVVASVGRQNERTVFTNTQHKKIAPVVCYESIYGDFIKDYIQQGAGFIGIITNDAWWGNTQGHQQHFHYARLRAIEHRKAIARAGNTGISGYINQRGDVIAQSRYNEMTSMKNEIYYNENPTPYTQLGDTPFFIIALIASLLSLALTFIPALRSYAKS